MCVLFALWLGWLNLDARISNAENDATNAGYVADDARSKAEEAKSIAENALTPSLDRY